MDILIIDNGSSYIGKLRAWFAGYKVKVEPFNSTDSSDWQAHDLVILSGGHTYTVINHDAEYANELFLIREIKKPVIGICLGFELVVHAFGGELQRLHNKETNHLTLQLVESDPILEGISSLEVFESHRWVAKSLGVELKVLGQSKDGAEIIRHLTRPIYGLQFHPEIIINQAVSDQLLKNILKLVN